MTAPNLPEEVRLQNALLKAQNEASMDGILVLSDQDIVLSVNRRFLDMWGLPAEALEPGAHASGLEAVRGQVADPSAFERQMKDLADHPDVRRHDEIVLKDGRTFDRYTAPLRLDDSAVSGRVWFFRDITETKRVEDAQRFLIRASTELEASLDFDTTLAKVAQLALPHLADWCAIVLLAEDGSIRRLVTTHVDLTKQELIRDFESRYEIDPHSAHPVAEVIRSGVSQLNPQVGEKRLQAIAPDENHIEMVRTLGIASTMIVPLRARGKTIGAMSLVSGPSRRPYDAMDLSLAEDLARRAGLAMDNARLFQAAQEAVQLRDEFLAAASHDLKGPLATIKGLSQLLARYMQRSPLDRERILDGLATIDSATDKMTSLINQLLDVSRVEMGHPLDLERRPTDLIALVRRVANDQQSVVENPIRVEVSVPTITGLWDPERIERVLTNLLSNAVKYSPERTEVIVRARLARPEESTVDAAVLEVQDFGIGIPATEIPRIFDRFHRAKNVRDRVRGSGVGLASAQQIVKQHGGQILVESQEGKGSLFTVILPLESEEQDSAA